MLHAKDIDIIICEHFAQWKRFQWPQVDFYSYVKDLWSESV